MTRLPACDGSPLAQPWISWRSLPADAFGPAGIAAMTAALGGMSLAPDGGWRRAADGDAAVAIRLALGLLPISAITPQVDLVMTALACRAAMGNPAAGLVLAKILRHAPIEVLVAGWSSAKRKPYDAGVISGPQGRQYFIEAVGAGLFARAMPAADANATLENLQDAEARATYAQQLVRERLRACRPLHIDMTVDGENRPATTSSSRR